MLLLTFGILKVVWGKYSKKASSYRQENQNKYSIHYSIPVIKRMWLSEENTQCEETESKKKAYGKITFLNSFILETGASHRLICLKDANLRLNTRIEEY